MKTKKYLSILFCFGQKKINRLSTLSWTFIHSPFFCWKSYFSFLHFFKIVIFCLLYFATIVIQQNPNSLNQKLLWCSNYNSDIYFGVNSQQTVNFSTQISLHSLRCSFKSIKTIIYKIFQSPHRTKAVLKENFCVASEERHSRNFGPLMLLCWPPQPPPFQLALLPACHSRALLRCQTFVCCRVSILWMPQGSVWDRGEYSSFVPLNSPSLFLANVLYL